MPVVDVFDKNKEKVGDIELKDGIFGVDYAEKVLLVSEVVRMQMASWRQGTHSTKTYATISGSGAKPYRQKGTGRARRGNVRASTIRGGAPAFGPQPRDYSYTMPKKKRKIAMRALLSERLDRGNLHVVKEFSFENIKTKDADTMLKKTWMLEDAIILGGDVEANFMLSVRNISSYLFLHYTQVNVYDVIAYKNIIITEEAAKHFNEVL